MSNAVVKFAAHFSLQYLCNQFFSSSFTTC